MVRISCNGLAGNKAKCRLLFNHAIKATHHSSSSSYLESQHIQNPRIFEKIVKGYNYFLQYQLFRFCTLRKNVNFFNKGLIFIPELFI